MQPGKYVAVWKLTADNQATWSKHFGHSLKIKIYVQDANGNLVYNKKEYKRKDKKKDHKKKKKNKTTCGTFLQQFDQLGFTNKKTNILLLKKTHGDFNQVLAILQSGNLANNNNNNNGSNNNNNNNNSNTGLYPTLVGTTSFAFAGNNSNSNNNNNNSV